MNLPGSLKRVLGALPIAAVATVATVGLSMGAPAAGAAGGRCEPDRSRTEEASRYARVYSVRRVQDDAVTRRWYACLHRTGRRVHLGDVGPAGQFSDRISPVRLAGRHVAFAAEYTASTGDALGAVVTVRDLRTGALVHRFQSPGDPNTYDVTDLELRAGGPVAWVARIIQGTPVTTTFEVRTFSTGESQSTIVDSGAAIDRRSLALSGATLYWSNDGSPRSTTLR